MPRGKYWQEEDTKQLQQFYGHIPNRRLPELFPGRTPLGIAEYARRLGLKKSPDRLREMGRENVNRRWHPPEIQA